MFLSRPPDLTGSCISGLSTQKACVFRLQAGRVWVREEVDLIVSSLGCALLENCSFPPENERGQEGKEAAGEGGEGVPEIKPKQRAPSEVAFLRCALLSAAELETPVMSHALSPSGDRLYYLWTPEQALAAPVFLRRLLG